jgi:hypothetical protein
MKTEKVIAAKERKDHSGFLCAPCVLSWLFRCSPAWRCAVKFFCEINGGRVRFQQHQQQERLAT